jgi:hypothetical protein
MKDLLLFTRYFIGMLSLVSHALPALVAMMALGASTIAISEGNGYWDALYFTLITGLMVVYGDIVSQTAVGKITSVLVGLIGLVFFLASSSPLQPARWPRELKRSSENTEWKEAGSPSVPDLHPGCALLMGFGRTLQPGF